GVGAASTAAGLTTGLPTGFARVGPQPVDWEPPRAFPIELWKNDRLVRVGPTVQSETTPGADESYNGNREPSISRHPTFSKAQCIVVLRWPPRAFPCPVG